MSLYEGRAPDSSRRGRSSGTWPGPVTGRPPIHLEEGCATMKRGHRRHPLDIRMKARRRKAQTLWAHVFQLEARSLPAIVTPFAPRFSANASGDILFVGNTLVTAPASDSGAANAQAGTGTRLNDN